MSESELCVSCELFLEAMHGGGCRCLSLAIARLRAGVAIFACSLAIAFIHERTQTSLFFLRGFLCRGSQYCEHEFQKNKGL